VNISSGTDSVGSREWSVGRARLTRGEENILRKRETLLLARTHAEAQLAASRDARHRALLKYSLAALKRQLADLEAPDTAAPGE